MRNVESERTVGNAPGFGATMAFVRALKDADSLEAVQTILGEATQAFEFDHFALLQRLSNRNSAGPIQLTDYPQDWIADLLRFNRFADDPVLVASERTVAAFTWRELPNWMPLTARQARYMASAREQGLGDGFTVPIHVPGEATGLCSFVTGHNRALPDHALPAMQYVACFAFEAARRLSVKPVEGRVLAQLTQRQLECVVLAAKGKSNWVVGELLGLSQQTVHKYLENAKKRYGVSSRTELVVRALFDGQLTFNDVIN